MSTRPAHALRLALASEGNRPPRHGKRIAVTKVSAAASRGRPLAIIVTSRAATAEPSINT
ncbi:MAG: hypothetical protein ACLGH3_07690 [Actinomycetota bacterium]